MIIRPQSLFTNRLSNDCLNSIFCYLSARKIYNLKATGDSKLVSLLDENVTILDFDTPFLLEKENPNTEVPTLKAPTFWHSFRNVTSIVLFNAPTMDFVIPDHILPKLKNFGLHGISQPKFDFDEDCDIAILHNAIRHREYGRPQSIVQIGKMHQLQSLCLASVKNMDDGAGRISIPHRSVKFPSSLSNSLTTLSIITSSSIYINPSTLPPNLETLIVSCGFSNILLIDKEAGEEGTLRVKSSNMFPSTLTRFECRISQTQLESQTLLRMCLSLPDTLQALDITLSGILVGEYQFPFTHALPKHLQKLSLSFKSCADNMTKVHCDLDLDNLPPKIEHLSWTVQHDLRMAPTRGEKIIALPPSLRFIEFKDSGFGALLWPHVVFTNPKIRIEGVDVGLWPQGETEQVRMGLSSEMIYSFHEDEYFFRRPGDHEVECYFNLHPVPPNVSALHVTSSEVSDSKHLRPLPNHIKMLEFVKRSRPNDTMQLPSTLTHLMLTLAPYVNPAENTISYVNPAENTISAISKYLPPTLTCLDIRSELNRHVADDEVDFARYCPSLRELHLKGIYYVPIRFKSLPPMLHTLKLVRITTNLWPLCRLLTGNIQTCHLEINTELLLDLVVGDPMIPDNVGSVYGCGWNFKLKYSLMGENCKGLASIPDILMKRHIITNRHLNFAQVEDKSLGWPATQSFYKRRDSPESSCPQHCAPKMVHPTAISEKNRKKKRIVIDRVENDEEDEDHDHTSGKPNKKVCYTIILDE